MLSIRTNMPALIAHRNMGIHQKSNAKAMRRLSSGYRINSAADDAAGLAISERMRGQIRGLQMASRNAQESVSMLQTAEGGLNETHSILQRMRELAVQSMNGTYNDEDRKLINMEYQALRSEINRISDYTNYNDMKLLNGSLGGKMGIEGLDRLGIDSTFGNITVTGGANFTGAGKLLLQELENGDFNFVLQVDNESRTATLSGAGFVEFDFNGTKIKFDGLNTATLKQGTVANILFMGTTEPDFLSAITAQHGDSTIFQVGANGGADQKIGVGILDMSSHSLGDLSRGESLGGTSILTVADAEKALKHLDKAINQVSGQRAQIGATINRMGHTINNLENTIENLIAAESTIRDADMAQEMMNFMKSNILLQAAQMMLSQAMQQPNIILQMLKSL